jgi:hypothetical protein
VTLGSPSFNRNADIDIKLSSGTMPDTAYKFSVRSPTNPAYDGNDLYYLCSVNSTSGCGLSSDPTYHFRPLMNSLSEIVSGSTSRENIFYFNHPYSEYTLRQNSSSGSCSYANCYVLRSGSAVQLRNVDALIFTDREIRPST